MIGSKGFTFSAKELERKDLIDLVPKSIREERQAPIIKITISRKPEPYLDRAHTWAEWQTRMQKLIKRYLLWCIRDLKDQKAVREQVKSRMIAALEKLHKRGYIA